MYLMAKKLSYGDVGNQYFHNTIIFMNLSERLKTWHSFQEFHPSREVYPRKICSEQGLELVLALNRKSHTQLL